MIALLFSPAAAALALTAAGYLSGSFLSAYYLPLWLGGVDVTRGGDRNPGVFNAYVQAGVPLGTAALVCELGKGFWPVWLGVRLFGPDSLWLAVIAAAPVFGHAFPPQRHFHGGKGIAVSFGVLMGFWPDWLALWLLVFFYLLFSLVLVVSPHAARSILTYALWMAAVLLLSPVRSVRLGSLLIGFVVIWRHAHAADAAEKARVRLFRRA